MYSFGTCLTRQPALLQQCISRVSATQVKSEQLAKDSGELEVLRQQLLQRERELSLRAAEQSSEGATLKVGRNIGCSPCNWSFVAALLGLLTGLIPPKPCLACCGSVVRLSPYGTCMGQQQALLVPSSSNLPALAAGQHCNSVSQASNTAAATLQHLLPHLQASLEAVATAQRELEAGRRTLAQQRHEVTTAQEQVARQQSALERQSRGLALREGQAKDRAQEADQQKVGQGLRSQALWVTDCM